MIPSEQVKAKQAQFGMIGLALMGRNLALNSEMARIWRGGCIIRARFLNSIVDAYNRRPGLPNLLLDDEFKRWILAAQANWRLAVKTATGMGVPAPAMSASLSYFDSDRTSRLPQNLTQAQRDCFGRTRMNESIIRSAATFTQIG